MKISVNVFSVIFTLCKVIPRAVCLTPLIYLNQIIYRQTFATSLLLGNGHFLFLSRDMAPPENLQLTEQAALLLDVNQRGNRDEYVEKSTVKT